MSVQETVTLGDSIHPSQPTDIALEINTELPSPLCDPSHGILGGGHRTPPPPPAPPLMPHDLSCDVFLFCTRGNASGPSWAREGWGEVEMWHPLMVTLVMVSQDGRVLSQHFVP